MLMGGSRRAYLRRKILNVIGGVIFGPRNQRRSINRGSTTVYERPLLCDAQAANRTPHVHRPASSRVVPTAQWCAEASDSITNHPLSAGRSGPNVGLATDAARTTLLSLERDASVFFWMVRTLSSQLPLAPRAGKNRRGSSQRHKWL
jgi:hypothetical protein